MIIIMRMITIIHIIIIISSSSSIIVIIIIIMSTTSWMNVMNTGNRGHSRANTCAKTRLLGRVVFAARRGVARRGSFLHG